jgi:hypothetical protein
MKPPLAVNMEGFAPKHVLELNFSSVYQVNGQAIALFFNRPALYPVKKFWVKGSKSIKTGNYKY